MRKAKLKKKLKIRTEHFLQSQSTCDRLRAAYESQEHKMRMLDSMVENRDKYTPELESKLIKAKSLLRSCVKLFPKSSRLTKRITAFLKED